MNRIAPEAWKASMPAIREKSKAFAAGEISKNEYKGFSGKYGTYAQKDPSVNMLRLRMPGGRITAPKLRFIADSIEKYQINKVHFTTCQAFQLHNLKGEDVCDIMESALDVGIVTMGGGGDFPRNTMCSPLSGIEEEYFDVLPYAQAAGEYAMTFIEAEKMPRKLKIGFSNSPANVTHATFRDLGFAARPDGCFDVYSAGGLGNNPRLGVKVAEAVAPEEILYYVKAMWITFRTYGNYENRGKARTRYMQEICGGPEAYRAAYLEKLAEVKASGEDLSLQVEPVVFTKRGDGTRAEGVRITPQKVEGLYTVEWHPLGGSPAPAEVCRLADAVCAMEQVEVRIAPDETVYIVNLTGDEAVKVAELTDGGAKTIFETSVSCIGATICQIGLRDSQGLLMACIEAVREAGIPDGALPRIHISGCTSSCGTHQIGSIGFRGASKKVDGVMSAAFVLYVGGSDRQGSETMGRELGTIVDTKIPEFLVALGKKVAESGMTYEQWAAADASAIDAVAAAYL